ncbi:MAG: M56 family metallopeptidase [Gemmatimonadetes bacterium]|nr:M56 family metallopeptidase [Gemmatimonadota bacterium]
MVITWVMYCLIVSASLGVAAMAAERALSHYRKPVRGVWLGAMAGTVLIPLAVLTAPELARSVSPVWTADTGGAIYLPTLSAAATGTAGAESPAFSIDALLVWIWGLSIAGLSFHLVRTHRGLRSEMHEWVPGEGLDAPVLMSEDRGPAVVGIRRAVIVMPRWIAELEEGILRLVFLHEREHQRAGDHRVFVAGIATLLTMPWNPIMWWQLRRLRLAIEYDCDHRVLGRGVDRRDYAEALLAVGSRIAAPLVAASAFAERKPAVERRLRRMTEPLRTFRGPRAVLAGTLGLGGILFACGSPLPTGPMDQPSPGAESVAAADATDDPSATPSFIPYDEPPMLQNPGDIVTAMETHYPAELKEAGITGRVELWLYVDETGGVGNQQVKTSSGVLALDEAALEVATDMRFSPAALQGTPTGVWVSQWMAFQVDTEEQVSARRHERPDARRETDQRGGGHQDEGGRCLA